MDTEIQFGKLKSIGDGWRRWLHSNMNALNATELWTSKLNWSLIDIKHYRKLHHQNRLALEHVSTMAIQSSPGDSLINLCNMLSLTSLGSSIFP